jgi:CheY-like chemotaxis protein
MASISAADDDADIRAVVLRALMRAGHTVTMVGDGAALVAKVRAELPDVVLTDNEMPAMTGLQAIRMLRDDPETADIPVVLASGSVSRSEAMNTLHDGDQFVSKPFTPGQLRDGVDAALRSTRTDAG